MSKIANKDKEIRRLRAKIRHLRAQNALLSDSLRALKRSDSLRARNRRLILESAVSRAELFSKKSFASFLLGSFKLKTLFSFYQRLVYIVRKYTFITTTLKILTFLLGVLQSGALIVLFTGTMAIALPLTLIFSYTAIVLSFIFRRRLTSKARAMLKGKRVTVFFPPRSRAFSASSYFRGMVSDAARDEESLSVVVSPYALLPIGISDKKSFFLAVRTEKERIIIMRSHYFFTFKKKILSKHDKDITFVF